ncbi:MAG: Calx-beta domain-containing protein, partial [bacterium]|nr:Calx-beta domain-containing protein [bacterium]
ANNTGSPLTINFTVAGTATSGTDYTALPASVSISNGETSATLNVTPIDDNTPEANETVIVTLTTSPGVTLGATISATVTIADDDVSSELTILAPTGTITDAYGNPTYSWSNTGAATYELAVWTRDYTRLVLYVQNIAASTYCDGATCSLEPTTEPTFNELARLYNGSYDVYVREANGTWAGPARFTLNAPPPGLITPAAATQTNTLQPTINFTLQGAAVNASGIFVYLFEKALFDAGIYTPIDGRWYYRYELCDGAASTTCSYVPPVALRDNTTYYAFLLSGGPGGISQGGEFNNGFVEIEFRVDLVTDPAIPTLQPVTVNQGVPSITFSTDANTTQHTLVLYNWTTGQFVWNKVYTKTGSDITCTATTCTITDPTMYLINGSYSAYVNGINGSEVSSGGPFNNGFGGPTNPTDTNEPGDFVLNFTVPPLVTGLTASVTGGNITATWTAPAGTTFYYVWIGTAGAAQTFFYFPVASNTLNCTATGGTCTFSFSASTLGIPAGTQLYFAVLSIGPGGFATTGGLVGNGYQVSDPFNVP